MPEVKRLKRMNQMLVGLVVILALVSGYYYTRFEEVQKQLFETQESRP